MLLAEDSQARDLSLKLYKAGRDYARQRGIIIADTKFEFGMSDGKLILIDEVLTPDSSRFWPADQYQPGRGQPSFDKQFVRDYLETLDWKKTPPGPVLPLIGAAIVAAGIGYASWARVHLGRNWSSKVVVKEDHALIRTGPYRLVRHPIYTGMLLALLGSAMVAENYVGLPFEDD